MIKVFLECYGCTANFGDYEIALGLLEKAGFEIASSPKDSDLNIILTCAVKTPTEHRMIYRIRELSKTNKPLIVAGCMTKINKKLVEKINSTASLIGPDSLIKIADVVKKTLDEKKVVMLDKLSEEKVMLPHVRTNPVIDIVQVSTGCSSFCSFCATKLARGGLFSYRPHSIREQIKKSLEEGVKEIWLTSQDISAYGKDIKTNLPDLLESIVNIEGDFFVRVGMMNPLNLKKSEIEKLVEIYKNPKIFKFLHLCVQSGSDKILKIMRRDYRVDDFVYYVEKFKEKIPNLTLSTDVIVGHPGEDENDFNETVELIKKIEPDIVNISKFGIRPSTPAAKMKQIDKKIINERSKKITKIVNEISLKKNKKWLGWEGNVLVDEKKEKGFQGRNYAYKPIVLKGDFELGSLVDVRIVDVKTNYLIGKSLEKL